MKTKHLVFPLMLLLFFAMACRTARDVKSDSQPISHEIWDEMLQQYVSDEGWVNYEGFIADSNRFNEYIALLKSGHPNEKNWNREERLAYWINAYNAFTVQIIMRNYPVESIKDIAGGIPFVNTTWDIKFIEIEGVTYDLNNIEHNILRKKFEEPRVHFAIVCASYSCPPLRNEAFVPENIDAQLDDQARIFLNDDRKNRVKSADQAELSKILDWYGGDFKKEGTLIEYINPYLDTPLNEDATISWIEYDWSINSQSKQK